MKKYSYQLRRTSDGRYILAVSGPTGFAHYGIYAITRHYEAKIRKILRRYRLKGEIEVPKRIDWDGVPKGDRIEYGSTS